MGAEDNLQVACQAKMHTLLPTSDTWQSAVAGKTKNIFCYQSIAAVAMAEPKRWASSQSGRTFPSPPDSQHGLPIFGSVGGFSGMFNKPLV